MPLSSISLSQSVKSTPMSRLEDPPSAPPWPQVLEILKRSVFWTVSSCQRPHSIHRQSSRPRPAFVQTTVQMSSSASGIYVYGNCQFHSLDNLQIHLSLLGLYISKMLLSYSFLLVFFTPLLTCYRNGPHLTSHHLTNRTLTAK